MLKSWWTVIIIGTIAINNVAPALAATQTNNQQITEAESREAREIALQFTTRFIETTDLTALVKELYVSDFIERYKKSLSENPVINTDPHHYFVPGLTYNARLLTEANPEDWQRFYIAANNFIFFGFISVIKKHPDEIENIKPTDLYPANVIKLLSKNPNLSDMVEKEGDFKSISTVEEMRNATTLLEQAEAMMREKLQGKLAAKIDSKELITAMKGGEFFKPHLEIKDEEFLGFPKGARFIEINTALLFRLLLVRTDGKLKILWAAPYTGD
ncbi:MAG TPA: hypothetical protein VKB86_10800 [Pyrinomonadaceae bacterium]|nr:hypothetical protein [Pyrinomonadaceae bacterium]